jgi:hypothetical protein
MTSKMTAKEKWRNIVRLLKSNPNNRKRFCAYLRLFCE